MTWGRLSALAVIGSLAMIACGAGDSDGDSERDTVDLQAAGTPSLLLVTLDTTRADHLAPYGGPADATPNLAALASAGALFEHAYAVAPTTLPAHATLFTGEAPTRHGVRHNGIHTLSDPALTLTEIVHQRGFATAAFVSSAVLERRYGLAQGFDVYDDEATATRLELGRLAERAAGPTIDRALRWLDGLAAGRRFFLWVHLYDPHAQYVPPPPYAQAWRERPYLGEIAYMDAELGRLLRHRRLEQDALIIAIGDHGESLGEHGEDNHGMLVYDATLRVPWIVRGPSVRPGLRVAAPASGVDLFRTALDLLDVQPTSTLPEGSRSWASVLESGGADQSEPGSGRARSEPPERPLYSETLVPFLSYGWAPLHAVRRGSWKLIDAPAPELYDTATDPGELRNRIAEEKAVARRLGQDLAAIVGGDESAASGSAAPLDAEQAEKLRSLGYLTAVQPRRRGGALPDPKAMMPVHRLLGEAQEALLRGDPRAANAKLDSVLASDPENVTALEAQGTSLARLGRLDQAESVLDRAIALDPARTSVVLAAAALRAQKGRLDQALELATLAATRDARSPEARIAVARYQSSSGLDQEAAASARRALELAPHSAVAEIAYADLVERPEGDLEAAETRLRRVVQREPLPPEGWLALGSVVETAHGADQAISIYRQGLERQPASGQLHAALGLLLAQARRPDAEEHLTRAAQLLLPTPASVERGLALIAIGRRDWKGAESAARRALAASRDDASAWTLLAAALEEQGLSADALAAYDDARRADPSHEPALFNRALLLRRLRRFTESAAQLDQLLALDPGHAKAHFELGVLYAGPLQDLAAARRHFELALENGHPDPELVRRALAELRPS